MINRSNRIMADAQRTARSATTCYYYRDTAGFRIRTSKDHKRELNHSRAGPEMILGHMECAAFCSRPVARYVKPTR